MFKYLKGCVTDIKKESVTLEINNLGFEIYRLNRDNFELNKDFKIYICESLSLDNGFNLYGFLDINDLIMFTKLILVNGIGYKTAFQILNNVESISLFNLISENNLTELRKISGIGSKANILVLELKNKLKEFNINILRYENIHKALRTLGYKEILISKAINSLKPNLDDEIALKEAIRVISNG